MLECIALEFSNGEYSDSKFHEGNNVIADIQKEENFSDLDDEYTDQEVPTNMDDGARARSSSVNDEQALLNKDRSHWRRSVRTCRIYIIFHIPHHTQQSSFFVLHPFQRGHAE